MVKMGSYRGALMTGFICRLCSEHKRVVIHLYSARAKQMRLLDKITMLPIRITQYDKLPKTICEKCINDLCTQFSLIEEIRRTVELQIEHKEHHARGGCPTACPFYHLARRQQQQAQQAAAGRSSSNNVVPGGGDGDVSIASIPSTSTTLDQAPSQESSSSSLPSSCPLPFHHRLHEHQAESGGSGSSSQRGRPRRRRRRHVVGGYVDEPDDYDVELESQQQMQQREQREEDDAS